MDQRTDEWYSARIGCVTASRVADIMAWTKNGPSASRKNYMASLVCERLTGRRMESFQSAEMRWGIDHEAEARDLYSATKWVDIEQVGFIKHPSIKWAGASPDGLVDVDGLVEIKCPNTATHIETLTTEDIDKRYVTQMQMQMDCTGRKWCDYVSFDPRLPASMMIVIIRVPRDDEFIKKIRTEINSFNDEVEKKIEQLMKLGA